MIFSIILSRNPGPRFRTNQTEAILKDLLPCESYLVRVGIVEPEGPGPLSRIPLLFLTPYDEKKPPRNLRASMNAEAHELDITWEHNCPLLGQYPGAYLITLNELTKNQTTKFEVKRLGAKVLKHTFVKIPNGAIYNVSIATNSPNAETVTVKVYAPPLPSVRQLKVFPEQNGTYVVFWHEVNDGQGP